MAVRDRSSRPLRRGAVALASVAIYAARRDHAAVTGVGGGGGAASAGPPPPAGGRRNGTGTDDQFRFALEKWRRRRRRLERLPVDSVHRVAFVTFSYVTHNDTRKLFDFLLPAVDTWAAPAPSYAGTWAAPPPSRDAATADDEDGDVPPSASTATLYVVFSELSREPFERLCVEGSGNVTAEQRSLCRRIRPIFVDCPEGRFGESPCCKQQEGLLELFEGRDFPLYDWYAFFDDDVYLRKEYVARLLAVLQPPDFPMAAIPYNQNPKVVGFGDRRCHSPDGDGDPDFAHPWGMPVFYSRGALDRMARGYRAGSLVRQCRAFDVTHDVGNALLHWMHSLPVAMLPPFQPLPDVRDDYIGSHWVGRDDVREELFGEGRTDRRGRATRALPAGDWSFRNAHRRWTLPANDPPDLAKLKTVRERRWFPNATGYRMTRAYARHGDPASWARGEWHTLRIADCDMRGPNEGVSSV